MLRKPTGRRFVFEDRRYTPSERRIQWMRRIEFAMQQLIEEIETKPGVYYTAEVEVLKGDPRYETAPLVEDWLICEHYPVKSTNLKLHPDNGR
jgi:hypothetical protein